MKKLYLILFFIISLAFTFTIFLNSKAENVIQKRYDISDYNINGYILRNYYYEVDYSLPSGIITYNDTYINSMLFKVYAESIAGDFTYSTTPITWGYYVLNNHFYVFYPADLINQEVNLGNASTIEESVKIFAESNGISLITYVLSTDTYYQGYNQALEDLKSKMTENYQKGYDIGQIDGYNNAYDEFFQPRYDLGYSQGLTAGNSQVNAIATFFPAIVGSIWGFIFDFLSIGVFGINLWAFVMIFASISLLILIIKILL